MKLLHSGWYLSMVPKVGKKMVYTAWTSKSGTTLRASNSANLVQNAIKLWHNGWFMSGVPKMANLQALKEVPDLLVHGEYTIFGIPEICWPLCQSFSEIWPKMAELQAFKDVTNLLVHAVYTNFCLSLVPLRYTSHCVKVLVSLYQKWPSYRSLKLCLICWCMRYTTIFAHFWYPWDIPTTVSKF